MYISDAGDGAGRTHGMDVRPSCFPFSAADGAISNLLDDHFGPGKSRMVQFATARSEPTDEFHKIQLRDKPNDPNTHSNYGAFLQDKKQDLKGAEKAFIDFVGKRECDLELRTFPGEKKRRSLRSAETDGLGNCSQSEQREARVVPRGLGLDE